MFDTAGDTPNAAMVRCNLSSLLRMRSNWEMNCYRSKAKSQTQSQAQSQTQTQIQPVPASSTAPASDNKSSKASDSKAVAANSAMTGDKAAASSSTSSDDAFAKYRESYRIALGHLKHAQRQCDYAVLALGAPLLPLSRSPCLSPCLRLSLLPLSLPASPHVLLSSESSVHLSYHMLRFYLPTNER